MNSNITPPRVENPNTQPDNELLPQPQNPFIGINATDTMGLVRSGILFLQNTNISDDLGVRAHGYFLFMKVLSDALGYQIEENDHD